MANTYPLTIGRGRRMKDRDDEMVMQEFAMKLKALLTVGTGQPTKATPGVMHIQYAQDNYSRMWVKCPDGTWR